MVDASQTNNALLPDLSQPGALLVPGLGAQNAPMADVPFGWKERVQEAIGPQARLPDATANLPTTGADVPLPTSPISSDVDDDAVKRRVLANIAKGEAKSYDTLFGGGKFNDYSQFPNWAGARTAEGPTHAAGLYQFQPGTWNAQAKKLGLTDFSPQSQDKAAWDLAETEYKSKTGRSLLEDARAGNVSWNSLAGQWSSLRGKGSGAVPEGSLPTAGGSQEHGGGGATAGGGAVAGNMDEPKGLDPKTLKTLMMLSVAQPLLQFHPVNYDPFKIQQLGVSNG